jgi:CRISPR/Cas system-associated exonuclease Cas4 (RecB family)
MSLKKLANKVKKEIKESEKTIEERFIESLDHFLVSQPNDNHPTRLAFRPSQYYKCIRQTYYFLKGLKGNKKRYPRSERILQVGTALHEWIQTQVLMKMDALDDSPIRLLPKEELPSFGKAGIEFIEEHQAPPTEIKFLDYRFTKKFPISAMIDGSLTMMNKNFLFEFKTINPDDFSLLIEPLKEHIKQGAVYSLCTGIRNVMFLYLCKGTQNWKAFLVTYSDEQLAWVVDRIQTTENYVLNDELPPKEESAQCKWCEYKNICSKDLKE